MKRNDTIKQTHHTPSSFSKLHTAAYRGRLDGVKALCTSENVNDTAGEIFFTPLYCAILGKASNEVVLHLLSFKECDINKCTSDGETPIMRAALNGNEKLVNYLLSKNAIISSSQLNKHAPFLKEQYPEIFKALQKTAQNKENAMQPTPSSSWNFWPCQALSNFITGSTDNKHDKEMIAIKKDL